MWLYNSSLCPQGYWASTVCQSITQEHTAFVTNWQTNIFHSCSSSVLFFFFFLDNPHNNLTGECMTTQCSPLLFVVSVLRTGRYQRLNTPHSLKKCVEYTAESCQNITKGQNSNLITFHCAPCICTTQNNNKYSLQTLRSFACSIKVLLCQSFPEDRLMYKLCFNRWAAWPSSNPLDTVSITGSTRGG